VTKQEIHNNAQKDILRSKIDNLMKAILEIESKEKKLQEQRKKYTGQLEFLEKKISELNDTKSLSTAKISQNFQQPQ